ncbi:hypothetical protein KUCAC02_011505, partial [Chaenocephalus aceratus]
MQRALYREVMAQLYKLRLRPALQYPAKLMITAENGDKVWLSSVEEAKRYLAAKQREGKCEIAVREKGFLLQGCVLLQRIGATTQ